MRAGRMDQRVTLLTKSVTRDAMGGEAITWIDARDLWAEVDPIRGREYIAASLQETAEISIAFRLHYEDASDVTSGDRITWRAVQYDIVDVIDIKARRRTIECMCQTAQNA